MFKFLAKIISYGVLEFIGRVTRVPFSLWFQEEQNGEGVSGGWARERFNSIIEIDSSVDEVVEEFELDSESCPYRSVDGYPNPYNQAYQEALEEVEDEAEALGVPPEALINYAEVEADAYDYACDLVEAWLDGRVWIPEEVLDWAWYEVSDHNY